MLHETHISYQSVQKIFFMIVYGLINENVKLVTTFSQPENVVCFSKCFRKKRSSPLYGTKNYSQCFVCLIQISRKIKRTNYFL